MWSTASLKRWCVQCTPDRSSFILRITYPQSSVTPPLAGPSGRRPPGMWRSPEPSPGSGGPPGLRATHAAWRRWWQPQKARLDHPGDVHFGLLKPISFIPWLWNGQVWPKGPYPNQTKKSTPDRGLCAELLWAAYLTVYCAPPLAGRLSANRSGFCLKVWGGRERGGVPERIGRLASTTGHATSGAAPARTGLDRATQGSTAPASPACHTGHWPGLTSAGRGRPGEVPRGRVSAAGATGQ